MCDSLPNIEHLSLHCSGPQAKGLDMLPNDVLPLGILLYPVAANPERCHIQLVHPPPSPPHLFENLNLGFVILYHGAGKVCSVELHSRVAIVQTLELQVRKRRQGTVPALRKLTGSEHTGAVCDPVSHFLHAVQACAGLRALVSMNARSGRAGWRTTTALWGSRGLL